MTPIAVPANAPTVAPPRDSALRSGAGEADAGAFEDMLAREERPAGAPAATPTDAPADAHAGSDVAAPEGPPLPRLPEAIAHLLRRALGAAAPDQTHDAAEDDADAPPQADAIGVALPQPLPAPAPQADAQPDVADGGEPPAPTPRPAATLGASVETSEASSDEAAGTETPDASLPARDAAPTAQRPGRADATDRGQPQSGGDGRREAAPQPRVERVVADAAPADAAPEPAAAEGAGEVKVSFVSYSRTAAPPAAPPVGAAAPAERAQAVTPPAPPPPPAPAQHLKLIMEPSGLGAVSLHLSLADAQVSVDMETQRHETRHALESGRDKLVESLTGAGYDVAHVQVKTAASDGGFDVTRRDGGQPDTPSDRAQQRGDGERAGRRGDQDRRQENADDPHLRAHRSGGVFL